MRFPRSEMDLLLLSPYRVVVINIIITVAVVGNVIFAVVVSVFVAIE